MNNELFQSYQNYTSCVTWDIKHTYDAGPFDVVLSAKVKEKCKEKYE